MFNCYESVMKRQEYGEFCLPYCIKLILTLDLEDRILLSIKNTIGPINSTKKRNKNIQCKDILTLPILLFLKVHQGKWCNWYPQSYDKWYNLSVRNAMPSNISDKLVLSKMRQLIKKGYVDGCDCGCRGDFEITDKGIELIGTLTQQYNK